MVEYKRRRQCRGKIDEYYIKDLDQWLSLDEMVEHKDNVHNLKRATITDRIRKIMKEVNAPSLDTFYKSMTMETLHSTGRPAVPRAVHRKPDVFDAAVELMNEAFRRNNAQR